LDVTTAGKDLLAVVRAADSLFVTLDDWLNRPFDADTLVLAGALRIAQHNYQKAVEAYKKGVGE
jgi:hypothetical protein